MKEYIKVSNSFGSRKNILKNQQGALSADFLFSFIFGIMMCLVLFVMSTTFALVEVAQYIAFSTSRSMIAGNIYTGSGQCSGGSGADAAKSQTDITCVKVNKLLKHKFISSIINNVWFELKPDSDFMKIGLTNSDVFTEYDASNVSNRVIQTGIRLAYYPKILQNLQISFFAPKPENIEGEAGKARVTGLLLREPANEECQKYAKLRYDATLQVDARFMQEPNHITNDPFKNQSLSNPEDLKVQIGEDNGC